MTDAAVYEVPVHVHWTRWQRFRFAVVLWWRRHFARQWNLEDTPHRVFWTRCTQCGEEVVNVAPISDVPRISWECGHCMRMTAIEVRSAGKVNMRFEYPPRSDR